MSVALALYALALLCEAVYEPGGIQFREVLTWRRMAGALSVTTWPDIVNVRPIWGGLLDLVAVLGMAGALVWLFARSVPEGVLGRVAVWTYSILLLACGGWAGLLMLLALPLQFPLDGEFLDESVARFTVIGIWMLLCLYAAWVARPRLAELDRLERVI